VFWRCICDCGKEKIVSSGRLTRYEKNKNISCGCSSKESYRLAGKRKIKDLSGKKFGKLTVIKLVDKTEGIISRDTFYLCRCECGKEKITRRTSLTTGKINSCGCLQNIKKNRPKSPEVVKRRIYGIYKRGAEERNLEFDVTEDIFYKLIESNCYYCGRSPQKTMEYRGNSIKYNGIDRLDNLHGYIKNNYVTCCEDCNKAKRMLTVNEFKNLITLIYNNFCL
ncbi:MAG: hypothetical protein WCZ12_03965, partial [Patescibacteria group bacterium]